MEITRDALLRIVKATRMSMSIAEAMQKMLVEKGRTWQDEVAGQLEDALFIVGKDHIPDGKDFASSQTMLLLNSDMDDSAVTDWFFMMEKLRNRIDASPENVQQPKPQTMSKEETKELYRKNGGYCYTPEGEFT